MLVSNPRRATLEGARPSVPGAIGLAFTLGTVAAIGGIGPFTSEADVPAGAVLGLAALWLAGAISSRFPRPTRTGVLLAIPGGVLLAAATPGFPAWTTALLVAAPACVGAATADLDERLDSSGGGPLLFAIALAGMYLTVPDTELVRVALGVALPLTLLAWPLRLAKLGRGGSFAATGLFLWIAVLEGVGRSGSTVGAVACLGMLIAEPLGRIGAAHERRRAKHTMMFLTAASLPALVAAQLVLAFYFARVAGFQDLAARAAALAAPAGLLAVIGAAVLSGSQQQRRRRRT